MTRSCAGARSGRKDKNIIIKVCFDMIFRLIVINIYYKSDPSTTLGMTLGRSILDYARDDAEPVNPRLRSG